MFETRQRRSTRVLQAVPLLVSGVDASGRPLSERTATISLNCHGCRYFSRYSVEENAWLQLEVDDHTGGERPRLRARVAWVRASRKLQGLYQVGVEFERPTNIWGLDSPPDDWRPYAVAGSFDPAAFEQQIQLLLAVAESGTYYQLLGIATAATRTQIKHAYYESARKFHPDRHMNRPEWAPALEKITDALTRAYKTLASDAAREKYDRRLARSGAFALGLSKTEIHKQAEECLDRARECLLVQNYAASIGWLRQAVNLDPSSSRNHGLLARSLAAVPQYRHEAVEHFNKAIQLDPLNAVACFQFAQLYEEMKLPWRAQPLYQRAVELNPANTAARERLGALAEAEAKKSASRPILGRLLRRIKR